MNFILSSQKLVELISAGPRLDLENFNQGPKKVDCIVTLQLETENLSPIQESCQKASIVWTWCPIRGINYELLKSPSLFNPIFQSLQQITKSLQSSQKIFIHCAAGIHRTGFFLYVLLRLQGLSQSQTLEAIKQIRPIILQKSGKHRLEISEKFFLTSQNTKVFIPYYEVPDIRLGDFLNPDLPIFAFFKVFFFDDLCKVQFSCTTFDFYKFVIGGEVFTQIEQDFELRNRRECFEERDRDEIRGELKDVDEVDEVLFEFLKSSSENLQVFLVGFDLVFDLEFFRRFCPKVFGVLDGRVLDLRTFEVLQRGLGSGSIYDDLRLMMKVRENILRI